MKRIILVLITLISISSAFANPNQTSTLNTTKTVSKEATQELIKSRLQSIGSEIELRYSAEVKRLIDADLTIDYNRKELSELIARSAYYLPIFESALKAAGLPDELKYIPVIESRLKEGLTSTRGAGGLWQIMPATARGYGMQVNATIDERRDPYMASEKACRMLREAYEMFGDWSLALASYNCGPGTVKKALRKAGGDPRKHNFWSISRYLPAQTRKYVPKFIAMTYVMKYYDAHNVKAASYTALETDTIRISSRVSLGDMANATGVSLDRLKSLNPQYLAGVVPATANRPCNLILPAEKAQEYRMSIGSAVQEDEPAVAQESVQNPAQERPAVSILAMANKGEWNVGNNTSSITSGGEDVLEPHPYTHMRRKRIRTVR